MVFLFALTGLVTGWLVNLASDYLPREGEALKNQHVYWPAFVYMLPGMRAAVPFIRLRLTVEALTMLVFAWLGARFGLSTMGLILAAGHVLFLLIAVIDWKYRLILNRVTYPAIVVVLVVHVLILHSDLRSILVGGMLAFGVFYVVFLLKPGQLGGGDVKLAALIGLTFGFPLVLAALLVGAGVGGAAAVFLLLRRAGKNYRIPYAPFLCFGAIAILLYYSLQSTL